MKNFFKKIFHYLSELLNDLCGCNDPKVAVCEPKPYDPGDSYFLHVYKIRVNHCTEQGYVGLNVSSDLTVQALQEAGFKAESVGVTDDNQIDRVIFKERPTHVIIKAYWVRALKLEQLAKRYPSCQFIVCCHSKPTFLAQEKNGFARLAEVIDLSKRYANIRAAANNEETASSFSKAFGVDVLYLPNVMPHQDGQASEMFIGTVVRVGIFCAIRPLKNVISQVMAAINYAHDRGLELELHVLSGRKEMGGDVVIKNLEDIFNAVDPEKYRLIQHPWLNHKDFLELCKRMDIGMQVSYTESFNIVTCDFLSQGVLIVTSPAVAWTPKSWQAQPDSLEDIQAKMDQFLNATCEEKDAWLMEGSRALKSYNQCSLRVYEKIARDSKRW